jgi:hypothetical protein
MDRVTQDENAYQADLAERDMKVAQIKASTEFVESLRDACVTLLDEDPAQPLCTLGFNHAVYACTKAHCKMIECDTSAFEAMKNKTIGELTVIHMLAHSFECEDSLFNKVLEGFM